MVSVRAFNGQQGLVSGHTKSIRSDLENQRQNAQTCPAQQQPFDQQARQFTIRFAPFVGPDVSFQQKHRFVLQRLRCGG